jgi:hypothetical protein
MVRVPTRITDAIFLDLVGYIYDAVCDPSCWPEFLRAYGAAIEGRGTLLFSHNMETMEASTAPEASSLNIAVDFDPEFLKSYDEYYSRLNVWAMNEPALKPGRAMTGSMLFPVRELPKTEWYNDFLRRYDYFHVIGGVVVRDGAWATHFSSMHGRREGDFTAEQVRFHQNLLPHLIRAVQTHRHFAFLQGLSESSFAVLDTVPAAVILLNASSRVLHSNASAEAELRRGDPFRLGPSGEICVRGQLRAQTSLRARAERVDPKNGVPLSLPPGLSGSLVWNTRRMECESQKKTWTPESTQVTGMLCSWIDSSPIVIATRIEVIRDFLGRHVV